MNVLINAYAVGPNQGSEEGVGWNWISELSDYCNLFIITEGEKRREIETAVASHRNRERIHFFFLPLPEKVRKMCDNQGDWRFYWYYKQWQKRALAQAREICNETTIDVVHQLNMVGFREPGYLWKLGKPLVWGPIGGLGVVDKNYYAKAPFKTRLLLTVKDFITMMQLKYSPRIHQMTVHSDALIAAIPDAQRRIQEVKHRSSILIPETGCYDLQTVIADKRQRQEFHILWVGRFLYTKRLDIALKSIAQIKDTPGLHLHVVGTGSEKEVREYRELSNKMGLEKICTWHGRLDNARVHEMMRNADLFFFTSVSEATSTVIPEAINNCLPIVCFNACGFGRLVTEKIGRTINLSTPEQSIKEFSEQIMSLYHDRQTLYNMSQNCREALKELLWKEKAGKVYEIYQNITCYDDSDQSYNNG